MQQNFIIFLFNFSFTVVKVTTLSDYVAIDPYPNVTATFYWQNKHKQTG
jgi:hypothetical protein